MKKRYIFFSKNWLRFGLVAVFAVFLSISSNAQITPVKQWDKTFGGLNAEWLYDIQQTVDGGYIIGGYSVSGISGDKSQNSKGGEDFWIVKLNAAGNKQWDKTLGGSGADFLTSMAQTADGGYILGGDSYSDQTGDKSQPRRGPNGTIDYWVVRLDPNGNKLWDKTFGGSDDEELTTVLQTPDGGYILGGSSESGQTGDKSQPNRATNGTPDFWLVKIDALGNKIWDKTYGGNNGDKACKVNLTSNGGIILGGYSHSGISGEKTQPSRGSADYWLLNLDAYGNVIWDKTFGGSNLDLLSRIEETKDGGFVLGGRSSSGISGDKTTANKAWADYWVIKLNSFGVKLWEQTLSGIGGVELTSLQQTADKGFVVGGYCYSSSGIGFDKTEASKGKEDIWIVKLDSLGTKTWDKTIGGSDTDYLLDLQQTADGGFTLASTSFSGISGDKSQASQGDFDYWIVKLGPETLGSNEPISNSQISISPNPSNGKFALQLNDIAASKVEVTVSDLLGRIVLQKELPVASKQVSEELEIKAAKGMYLLQIKAGNQTTSRKIVIQ